MFTCNNAMIWQDLPPSNSCLYENFIRIFWRDFHHCALVGGGWPPMLVWRLLLNKPRPRTGPLLLAISVGLFWLLFEVAEAAGEATVTACSLEFGDLWAAAALIMIRRVSSALLGWWWSTYRVFKQKNKTLTGCNNKNHVWVTRNLFMSSGMFVHRTWWWKYVIFYDSNW